MDVELSRTGRVGSGATAAACKTLFTQRLKLSGMQWSKAGAQQILTLRTILQSGIWEPAFTASLIATCHHHHCRPYRPNSKASHNTAA